MAWDLNELYGQRDFTVSQINKLNGDLVTLRTKKASLESRNFELSEKYSKYNPFKKQLDNLKKTIENAKSNSDESKKNFSRLLKSDYTKIKNIEITLGRYNEKLSEILRTLTSDCSAVNQILQDIQNEMSKNNDEISKYARAINDTLTLLGRHQTNLNSINGAIATFN